MISFRCSLCYSYLSSHGVRYHAPPSPCANTIDIWHTPRFLIWVGGVWLVRFVLDNGTKATISLFIIPALAKNCKPYTAKWKKYERKGNNTSTKHVETRKKTKTVRKKARCQNNVVSLNRCVKICTKNRQLSHKQLNCLFCVCLLF